MSLLDHLQLFDSVVPTRFGLALIPVIAILLAFSVRAAATASHAWLRYGWTLVLVAALLPIAPWPVPAERAAPVPGFFTSGQWRQYVPDDQSVFAVNSVFWIGSFTTMDWDNATGQEYRMVGGYFLGPFPGALGELRPSAAPDRRTAHQHRPVRREHPDHRCAAGRLPGRCAVLARRDRGAQPGRAAL